MNLPWRRLDFKDVRWPGGARMAVLVNIEFEAIRGGPSLGKGTRDFLTISRSEFEARRGVWRILEALEKLGIPGTVFVNGATAEQFPEAVSEIHRRGHEINAHGYEAEALWALSEGDERQLIEQISSSLKKITGKSPPGWLSPKAQPSENTMKILIDLGFVWNSDLFDSELPYLIELDGKRILEMPRSSSTDDISLPYTSPKTLYDAWREEFDYMYMESATTPTMFMITLHPHIAGRPSRSKALADVVSYIKGHSGIWFTTNTGVAEWCLKNLKY